MKRSILDAAIRLERLRLRRRLRRLAMTSYRENGRAPCTPPADAALQDLDEALPHLELLILQITARRAWA